MSDEITYAGPVRSIAQAASILEWGIGQARQGAGPDAPSMLRVREALAFLRNERGGIWEGQRADHVNVTLPLWVAIVAHEAMCEEWAATADLPEAAERHEALDIATDALGAVIPSDLSERLFAAQRRVGAAEA